MNTGINHTDIRDTDLRVVTRRVYSAVAPLSERDRRVVERIARRDACHPGADRDGRPTLGRWVAERVVSMIATLPGIAVVTGRKREAVSGARPGAAANEDRPALRAA